MGIGPTTYGLEERHNLNSQVVGRTTDSPATLSRCTSYPHVASRVKLYRHVPKCSQTPHKSPHSQHSHANTNILKIRSPGGALRRPNHRSRSGDHRDDSPLPIHPNVGVGAPRWRQRRRDSPASSALWEKGLVNHSGLPSLPSSPTVCRPRVAPAVNPSLSIWRGRQ